MADQRLRAIIELQIKGDQKARAAIKGLSSDFNKATIQQGVMAQRSSLLSREQDRLSKQVVKGKISVDQAAQSYKAYTRDLIRFSIAP